MYIRNEGSKYRLYGGGERAREGRGWHRVGVGGGGVCERAWEFKTFILISRIIIIVFRSR